MSKQQFIKPINKTLIFALLIGVLVFVEIVVEFLLGFHTEKLAQGSYLSFLRYVFFIVGGVVLALQLRKNNIESFVGILKYMLFYTLVLSIVIGIAHFVYHQFINTHFHEDYISFMVQKINESDISAEHKELKISELKNQTDEWKFYNTPLGAFLLYAFETLVVNIILSLMLSSLLYKNQNKDEHVANTVR